jgi:methyl-accepting chemotaxis protein
MSEAGLSEPNSVAMPNPSGHLLQAATAGDAEMASYPPRLEIMSAQLKQTSAQIEESIVGVCVSFQGIAERARASSIRTTGFLSQGDNKAAGQRSFDGLIESCGETMVKLMHTSTQAGEVAQRTVKRVEQMDHAAREITDSLMKLEGIAMSNRILALNARIEAARSVDGGDGFAAVAVELASQTDKSQAVTRQVADMVERLRALAESTRIEQQQMQMEGEKRVKQSREDVQETLQALQAAHARMKEMLSTMTEEGALLSQDIGAAVRGLQFQDRVSQRIAHVVEDIETIRGRLVARYGSAASNDAVPGSSFSGHSMREEREVYGIGGEESDPGDIELF